MPLDFFHIDFPLENGALPPRNLMPFGLKRWAFFRRLRRCGQKTKWCIFLKQWKHIKTRCIFEGKDTWVLTAPRVDRKVLQLLWHSFLFIYLCILPRRLSEIEEAIRKGISDADVEARAAMRR